MKPWDPRTMLSGPAVAACAVFTLAVLLLEQPWSRPQESAWHFEIEAESDQAGLVQLYFDVGHGLNETDSVIQTIPAGRPTVLRFPLPSGTYRTLRFDPNDRPAKMTFQGARIADGAGHILRSFGPERFKPQYQVDAAKVEGPVLRIETTPGGFDPQIGIELDGPLHLAGPRWGWRAFLVFLVLCVGCAAGARLGLPGSALGSAGPPGLAAWALRHPRRALLAVAALATVAANFPVVFGGRSIVTPSFGVALLYGQNPWVPGFQSAEVTDPHKADVAALLWHHLPLSMVERRAVLRDGELPLWNRFDSGGSPLLGQGQSCFGDPLSLLPILADGAAWSWDVKFLVAKGLFAFGLGLCAWRCWRHLPSAAMVAASAPFFGYFVYRINHPAIFSLCYSPWILYCWLGALESRSPRSAVLWFCALVASNWAELNSGTVKEAYILILTLNATGVCALLAAPRPVAQKAALAAGALVSGAVFVLAAAPVWMTFLRALKASYTSYNSPLAFQLQPGMVLGLFDEAFYRTFQLESGVVNPSANVLVLAGLLWAAVRWRAITSNRLASALLIAAVPSAALVFGVIPSGLVTRTPFLGNILHIDNTFSCSLIVVLAVLSGAGWREAFERLGSREGRREAALVVGLLLVLWAAFLGTAQAVVRSAYWDRTWGKLVAVDPFLYGYGMSLAVGLAVFLGALEVMRRRGGPTAAALVFAVLGFGALTWRGALQVDAAHPDYVVQPTHRVDLQAPSPTVEAIRADSATPYRVLGLHDDFLPGWSGTYGLEGISGPDALVNPRYRELLDAAGINRIWDWRYIVEAQELRRLKPVFDLLNVRYYVAYRQDREPIERVLRPLASLDMDAFVSDSAWPRAFFTDSAAVYTDPKQFCSWVKAGDGRPFAGIQHSDWVTLSPVPRVSGDLTKRVVRPAEGYALTTNTTAFTVTATGPGFIVLSEAYEASNFSATVDGSEVPVIRVNHAFKGLYVDGPGTYRVVFSYWPSGFTRSLCLGALGGALWALALAWAAWSLHGRPNRIGPAPA
jgi:hypothetical protein